MTKEEKSLLLKDLCARLPYGVKVWYKYYSENVTEKFATSIRLVDEKIALSRKFNREGDWYPVEEANELLIKPYLRPMTSMTEEEDKEFWKIVDNYGSDSDAFDGFELGDDVDWLNAYHFDYRGLIPMGLALGAPKEMYNIKEQ